MNTDTLATLNRSSVAAGFVCPLKSAQFSEFVGGKASNLGKMIDLGIDVPPGFVITDQAFQLFLDENELRTKIDTALAGLKPNQLEEINTASQFIRSRILAATIPDEVLASIYEMVSGILPGTTLAVRSSAIGEDSHEAAFAGQLDSFLNIDSNDALVEAVLACWASYWSQRSVFYQLSRGIYLQGMGVVIQELVASRISGILFTRNPDSSNSSSESLVVEYCFGHGDDLAAGKLNPGRCTVSRDDFSWQMQATPEQGSRLDDTCLFNEVQIERLSRAALTLESHFGCPQDIEWTIDENGRLYLVQTRPITVGVLPKPISDDPSHENSSDALVLWSNANVNENFPEPISPFLHSIASAGYYNYFRNLGLALGFDPHRVEQMEYPLRNVIGVHGGRMYYNLTNIHAILRMAPAGELLAQWFDDFVGVAQADDKENTASSKSKRSRWARSVELCRSAFKTTWQFLFLSNRVAAFEQVVDEFADATQPDNLAIKPLSELLDDLRGFMDIRCNRWTNASLADTAAMVTYGLLKRLLTREFPDRDQSGLHNSLLKGLQDVVSGKPIVELWSLSRMVRADAELKKKLLASKDDARVLEEIQTNEQFAVFRAAFETFLKDWGFRCSGELMLTVPSFQEQPESLLEMLRAYVDVEGESPLDLLQRQSSNRVDETAKVMKQLRRRKLFWPLPCPSKATLVSIVLKKCHKSIALRERARLKQALLYSRCRRIALAIADQLIPLGMLEFRNDIFFLSIQEIESLLAGSTMFPHQTKELVQFRRNGHQQLSAMEPDDWFVLPAGEYLPIETHRRSNEIAVDGSQTELAGVGACGGQVTAPAAILTDISECQLLNEGDVLVTRQTDPGWGPVFFLIKGLVMERGGMLSHGSILAREYGIPTVVGVPNATQRISPGQKLNVNGDRGIVQLVD